MISIETTDATVFYSLPTEAVTAGMSTDDGQDILDVVDADGQVFVSVYTPSEDPDIDNERQCAPETRIYAAADRIDLAVFPDTEVDGSVHPLAILAHPLVTI